MAAAVPAAAAAMDPAMISAIFAALGPLLKSFTGDQGGPGSTYNDQQLEFMNRGLKGLNPNQGDITQNQGYQQGMEWLSNLFNDPNFFKTFEAPLMRQYEEETIPGLANRFAGMGSGSLGSTGFRNAATREAGNLHANIAALRGGMQQQGVNQALQYAQQPVSNYFQQLQQFLRPTQNTYQQAGF